MVARSPLSSPLTTARTNGRELDSPASVIGCPETFIDIPTGHAPDVDRLLESRSILDGSQRCVVRRERSKGLAECSIEDGQCACLTD